MAGTQLTATERREKVQGLVTRYKDKIAQVLPRHLTPERMTQIAIFEMQRVPRLAECEPGTLVGSVLNASVLGLEIGSHLGEAYLVPFWSAKRSRFECQLIPGYRGLTKLARQSRQLVMIDAHCVFEKDKWDFRYGLEPKLEHMPARTSNAGEMIAVYAVAHLRDGGRQFVWMWREEVEKVRAQSKSANDGPWVTHFEEMAKKTAIRRLCKYLPMSAELGRATMLDNQAETDDVQDVGLSNQILDLTLSDTSDPEPAEETRSSTVGKKLKDRSGRTQSPKPAEDNSPESHDEAEPPKSGQESEDPIVPPDQWTPEDFERELSYCITLDECEKLWIRTTSRALSHVQKALLEDVYLKRRKAFAK